MSHHPAAAPPFRLSAQTDWDGRPIPLYGPEGFAGMRRAGALAAATLDFIADHVRPGVTTDVLDDLCAAFMRDHGGEPAALGYRGYPRATCVSVNQVATHGIPSPRVRLRRGDIVNIDVTPKVEGWHGDASRTFLVGAVRAPERLLVAATEQALDAAIAAVRPGAPIGVIAAAIEAVAHTHGFTVVHEYTGHGVGLVFHDAPTVFHARPLNPSIVLEPGMIFTIEPMLNAGGPAVRVLADGWTTVTCDGRPSAQVEHSLGVTADGVEVFTRSRRVPAPGWDRESAPRVPGAAE